MEKIHTEVDLLCEKYGITNPEVISELNFVWEIWDVDMITSVSLLTTNLEFVKIYQMLRKGYVRNYLSIGIDNGKIEATYPQYTAKEIAHSMEDRVLYIALQSAELFYLWDKYHGKEYPQEQITDAEVQKIIDYYQKALDKDKKMEGKRVKGQYSKNAKLGKLSQRILDCIKEIQVERPYLFIADFLQESGALEFKGEAWNIDFVAKLDSEKEKQVKQWIDASLKQ